MLKVKNLSKTLSGKVVLENVSFTIEPGSVVGLLGRNGVGKTTLLRTIIGVLDPDAGEVLFNDHDTFQCPELKQRLVFVPDKVSYLKSYHIDELANWFPTAYPSFDSDYFYDLIERFQLPSNQKIRHFSKGMKALLHIILYASTQPDLMILDEPTDGLDPVVRTQILQFLVEEVSQRNLSLLISTHNIEEIEKIADHVMFMKDGQIGTDLAIEKAKNTFKKVQVAFPDDFPEELKHLPEIRLLNQTGRVATLLIVDQVTKTMERLKEEQPLYLEEFPMTLEDVFINKLGGDSNVS